jgi:hypothetical protein
MRFVKRSEFSCTPEELFRFHERPDAILLLTPQDGSAKVVSAAPSLEVGAEAVISMRLIGPIRKRWVARHTVYEPPVRFVDEQIEGPFKSWVHEHRIEATATGAALVDTIDYELPLGPLGRIADAVMVRRTLQKAFDARHEVTRRELERGG